MKMKQKRMIYFSQDDKGYSMYMTVTGTINVLSPLPVNLECYYPFKLCKKITETASMKSNKHDNAFTRNNKMSNMTMQVQFQTDIHFLSQ